MQTKCCSRCGDEKALEKFSTQRAARDGRQGICTPCRSKAMTAKYHSDPAYRARKLERDRRRLAALTPEARKQRKHREWIRICNDPERRERIREQLRQWARRNYTLKLKAKNAAYAKIHAREWKAARRARLLAAAGVASAAQIRQRIEYYGGRCWVCAEPYTDIDHVKPLAKGGSNWPANLRPICGRCNKHKGARWPFGKAA